MDYLTLFAVLFSAYCLWFNFLLLRRRPISGKLPPGPYPFPIIGNILQLGQFPHRTITNLSQTYGPLISLRLGSVYTVCITSSQLARDLLQKHDRAISSRPITAASEALDHHKYSVGLLPVGADWRRLRKLCQEHLFCPPRLEASQGLRHEKIQKLRDYIRKCSDAGRTVDIGEAAFVTVLNLMSATVFSDELTEFDSGATEGFRSDFQGFIKRLVAPNVADFFPVLKPFDPQGIQKGMKIYTEKVMDMIDDRINRRLKLRQTSAERKADLLETLLDLVESGYGLSITVIKHFLMDMFVAGVDTTVTVVEWGMTEVLLDHEIKSNVKKELDEVIGDEKQQVKESDFGRRFPYLEAVIKEVLRCHPPGPLMLPHKAEEEVEINGYTIPKGTQILFNVWAMHMDPNQWKNPDSFEPQRFLGNKVSFKGQDFSLIPFGSGRRMCPGIPLADRMLHSIMVAFIHGFDWKLHPNTKPGQERSEKFELSLRRAAPLFATPINHLP